ncbi:CxxH/CxxC protein [Sutcliffiella cohnii]|uniref:CxxH/CxxC protein n=1 Tax=Sutcliffiella cohnii TaxID=33932 RepID=UPI002E1FC90A
MSNERIVDKMVKCCEEHIELAMEMYIDQQEEAPPLALVPDEEKLSTTCEFCQNVATYMVGN